MATQRGVVKKTLLKEFSNPRRKGVWALNIDEGDQVIAARLVHQDQQIMLFTRNGMAVRFDETKVRSMGRWLVVSKGLLFAMRMTLSLAWRRLMVTKPC